MLNEIKEMDYEQNLFHYIYPRVNSSAVTGTLFH